MSILRPLQRPILQPVLRSVFDPPLRRGSSWSPADLFANGEQGALYYFTEDFAGLYQDAAGTTPVTAVGQPVGLMLDRRFGLARGPEMVTDGAFTDPAAWAGRVSGDWVVQNGRAEKLATTVNSNLGTGVTVLERAYLVEFDVISLSSIITVQTGNVSNSTNYTVTTTGRNRGVLVGNPGAGSSEIVLRVLSTQTAIVDNLSIRELPGNHASQATTTARPTLRSSPLRIDYDGVDDYLRTVFPDLGSDVTIARSIPGVGAQILTGQTIAAGNWDDNVTSCATLVIDRALTGPETALVTAFLNQQAGV